MKCLSRFISLMLIFILLTSCNFDNSSESSTKSRDANSESLDYVNYDDEVVVTVSEKTSIQRDPYNQIYSDRVEFVLKIESIGEKDILGVRGTLRIRDMFDEDIHSLPLQLTYGAISVGTFITVPDIGMDIDKAIEADVKLFNESYDALKFDFLIYDVVYSDDIDYQNKTIVKGDPPAQVDVINKKSIEYDFVEGILSPRVEFEFELTNLSERDIKGLQGYISISNIFGEEITNYNCDFTSNIIPIGNSIISSGLGVEISYDETDLILFATPYEGLVFEYHITAVVFTDGTKVEY